MKKTILQSILITPLLILVPQSANAFDFKTLPLIGTLINLFSSQPQTNRIVNNQPVSQQPQTQYFNVPQPAIGYAYVQGVGNTQVLYNIYRPNPIAPNGQVMVSQPPSMNSGVNNSIYNNQTPIYNTSQVNNNNQNSNTGAWNYNVNQTTYEQNSPIPYLPESIASNSSTSVENISIDTQATATRVIDTNSSGKYRWPISSNSEGTQNPVTSIYGPRDRDLFIKGCSDGTTAASLCGVQKHNGIDIKAPIGTPIESITSGSVAYISPYCSNPGTKNPSTQNPSDTTPRGGCTVSIMNDKGEMVTYQHLSDTGSLKVGDQVKAGDVVGKTGNSGVSSGPHLDLSICEVSQEKVQAAQAAKKDLSRCELIGGTQVNPIDRLDDTDPRYQSAKDREKANTEYISCKKKAGNDSGALQKCRDSYAKAKTKIENTKYTGSSNKDANAKNDPLAKANWSRI